MSPELQAIKQLKTDEAKDDAQFLEAFRSLLSRLQAVERGLRFTMEAKEARLKTMAQQIYGMAKSLNIDRTGAPLGLHIDKMKRARNPRRTKKEATAPAPIAPGKEVEGASKP